MDDHHKVKAINRNMEADEAAAAAAAAAGGAAFESGSSQSLLADLLSSSSSTLGDDLGISTVATFVLFGASTFAAVGMFSKTWMLEDYRGVCVCVCLLALVSLAVVPLNAGYVISRLHFILTLYLHFGFSAQLLGLEIYLSESHKCGI